MGFLGWREGVPGWGNQRRKGVVPEDASCAGMYALCCIEKPNTDLLHTSGCHSTYKMQWDVIGCTNFVATAPLSAGKFRVGLLILSKEA